MDGSFSVAVESLEGGSVLVSVAGNHDYLLAHTLLRREIRRALANEPEAVVLDTSDLQFDDIESRELIELAQRIVEQAPGTTLRLVTQAQPESEPGPAGVAALSERERKSNAEASYETSSVFKQVNDNIRDVSGSFSGGEIDGAEFFCECDKLGCSRMITISHDVYDLVRSDPLHRIVLPEHVAADRELVIERMEEFVVIKPLQPWLGAGSAKKSLNRLTRESKSD